MCKTCAEAHKLKTRHNGKTPAKAPGERALSWGPALYEEDRKRELKEAVRTAPCLKSYLQAFASPSIIPSTSHAKSKETTNMHTGCSVGCLVSPAGESYSWNTAFLRGLGRGVWAESSWEAFWTFFKGHSLLLVTAAMTQTDGYYTVAQKVAGHQDIPSKCPVYFVLWFRSQMVVYNIAST